MKLKLVTYSTSDLVYSVLLFLKGGVLTKTFAFWGESNFQQF